MRRPLIAIVGFAALVLSPQAACTTEDEGLSQAQIDALRSSVEGTWEYKDGATTIQFRVTQSSRDFDAEDPYAALDRMGPRDRSSLVGTAYACGNHGLVKPASACIDVYHMPLDIEVTTGPALDAPRGTLTSYGGGPNGSEVWIRLGSTELRGTLVAESVTIENAPSKTLHRIAP